MSHSPDCSCTHCRALANVYECEACNGNGEVLDDFYTPPEYMPCNECDGSGHFDQRGNPVRLDGWGLPIQMEERA